ncbi:hypothetical protein [Myroides marinus]|uniref:hypothetical protein n=1 Tax=Myroides marinus TaxID=703342 RepID=UPI0025768771|nr:hypothetical protein [Myroides marinus]MDM1345726.1 hypothetical protein [Myroides marinus]
MKGATKPNFTQKNLDDIYRSAILHPLLKDFYNKAEEIKNHLIKAVTTDTDLHPEDAIMKHNSKGLYLYKGDDAILFINIADADKTGRTTTEGINMFYKHPINGFALSSSSSQSNIADIYKKSFFKYFSI